MDNLVKEFDSLLDEIGEITSNYKPYKIEDHELLYRTFHSCSVKTDKYDFNIGYNVSREKSTNHMKVIEVYQQIIPGGYYLLIIDFITPSVEMFEILDNGNRLKSMGRPKLEEINMHLRNTVDVFKQSVANLNSL